MRDFWKRVVQRAFRRGLELARIESRERLFVFLVLIAVPAFATWHFVGDHTGAIIRALASLFASAAAVLAVFLWNVLKLPAVMEAESEAERLSIVAMLKTQQQKAQLRDEIGELMLHGAMLKRECADETRPEPEAEANQWLAGVIEYLQKNMGVSYVARVNDGSAVPIGLTSLSGNRAALDSGLRIRLYHLDQFLRELA